MRATSILTGIALFGAGLFCGWLLANWSGSIQTQVTSTPNPVSLEPVVQSPETQPSANMVWLTVEFDGGSALVPAARLRNTGLLIASLYSVYPANSVHYLDADGEQIFPQVIGADHLTNLIALKDTHDSGYVVSQDDGSLFVGKPIALELPDGALQGQVASSLQTATDGRHYFNVDFTRAESGRGGPLLAPGTSDLIGFVTTSRNTKQGWMHLSGDVYSAIDATSVRNFLRSTDQFFTPQSARSFTARFARTAGGLRYAITQFAERQQWEPAYRALEALTSLDGNNTDVTQRALTLSAYYHGHQLVENGDPNSALTLTSELRSLYPLHQPWCLVESRAFGRLNQWDDAFSRAKECLQDPYGSTPRDRELDSPFRASLSRIDSRDAVLDLAQNAAIQFARDDNTSRQLRINTLLAANDLSEHPHIYRLLGDFEYDAKNYTLAQRYYRSAIRLDPSIAASLGNRLRNSSQRANSAPASEIPFEKRSGGMVVTARINDSPQTFRLLVDTGATYSALSGGTLLRLGLGNVFNNSADVVELEAAGGTLVARRFTLDSMQIGDARVTQMPVVILENLEGFDGLVGLSFLRHFDMNIDQEAGKLILVQQ